MSEISLMVKKDFIHSLSVESPFKLDCVYFLRTNSFNVYSYQEQMDSFRIHCPVGDVHGRCGSCGISVFSRQKKKKYARHN